MKSGFHPRPVQGELRLESVFFPSIMPRVLGFGRLSLGVSSGETVALVARSDAHLAALVFEHGLTLFSTDSDPDGFAISAGKSLFWPELSTR